MRGVGMGILVLIVIIAVFYALGSLVDRAGNSQCFDKYGAGWEYRLDSYGPDVCVNSKGEFKYL